MPRFVRGCNRPVTCFWLFRADCVQCSVPYLADRFLEAGKAGACCIRDQVNLQTVQQAREWEGKVKELITPGKRKLLTGPLSVL